MKKVLFLLILLPVHLLAQKISNIDYIDNQQHKTTNNSPEDVQYKSTYIESKTGAPFKMVFIQGGYFKMGSDKFDQESPIHNVTVNDFWMGETEVTVAQFAAFVKATNYKTDAEKDGSSSVFKRGKWEKEKGISWRNNISGKEHQKKDYNTPVIHVSWNDAKAYCRWLSKKTGHTYTLPSEAQWEFSAGGGLYNRTTYSGGENINDIAWYWRNARKRTNLVKTKKPNHLGLYDMSGNVWEWCEDSWHKNYKNAPINGRAWMSNYTSLKVLRGGSWLNSPKVCRVAIRKWSYPDFHDVIFGFRIVRNTP